MTGRILIVDTVATNRIVLKVKLTTAQYRVTACASIAEAKEELAKTPVNLIVVDTTDHPPDIIAFCSELRSDPDRSKIPIIAMGHFGSPQERVALLDAGASVVMNKPMSDILLLARIRSLLRISAADEELHLRDDTSRALGFAEAGDVFVAPGKVAVVSDSHDCAKPLAKALSAAMATNVHCATYATAVSFGQFNPIPDLFVIDARNKNGDFSDDRLFRLIADLRSRRETQHAAQLIISCEDGAQLAAMVLDLGANDVVPHDATIAEVGIFARRLIRRKIRMEKLRDTVQTGLKAAVTDSLTGLYNRRYALPHIKAMVDSSVKTGRSFALMVIDIDHFKLINDSHGHAAGDKVISGIANLIRDNLRSVDLVARIGGEEFLVAMPETTIEQAQIAAERLRFMTQNTPIAIGPTPPVSVTVSIGVVLGGALKDATQDIPLLIDQADAALYDSKSGGRNMVTMRTAA